MLLHGIAECILRVQDNSTKVLVLFFYYCNLADKQTLQSMQGHCILKYSLNFKK